MVASRVTLLAATVMVALPGLTFAADYVWTGASGSEWSDPANWSPAGVPSVAQDTASFSGSGSPAVDLGNAGRTVGAVNFAPDAAAAFTLSNGEIALAPGGSITKHNAAGAFTQTIAASLSLSGNASILNNDGVNEQTHPAGDRRLVISGAISGAGTLRLGGGTTSGVELAGNNAAFTGGIEIDGGLIVVGSANALGDTAGGTTINGGQVWFRSSGSTAEDWTIAGNTQWRSYSAHTQSGNITVSNDATWNIHNGSGNDLHLPGAINGEGNIHFEFANTRFTGSQSNTLTGKITHAADSGTQAYNTLYLGKTGGATAIAGNLELTNRAVVQWNGNNQIADTSAITLQGGTLHLNGHSDTVGALTLGGKANIDLSGTGSILRFADSSALTWNSGQVIVRNWSAGDGLFVGANAAGLNAQQVARIGFMNPDGRDAGLYRATIENDGRLVPDTRVQAVNPPFSLAAEDVAARAALYTSIGRAKLAGVDTPLSTGSTITFFGDSITWLGGYVGRIDQAVQAGAGTAGKGITLHNRGINGGGVGQVLNGSTSNTVNGQPQPSFAQVLQDDGTDIAVVFIGINDVRFLGTSAQNFESGLRAIAQAAENQGTDLVLATLSVSYEKPDGTNPDDAKIEQFAQITRLVAAETGSTLVDLRAAYMAYLQNHNYELQLDGSLTFQTQGLLTYDGLHPTSTGIDLLADLIAQGIYDAAAVPEPAAALLLMPAGALLTRPLARKR